MATGTASITTGPIRWRRRTTSRGALDELGDAVLDGADPSSALRDLLRRGVNGRRGLDDLLRRVRDRQREIRDRGRLDGILEEARALLDTAVGQERAELFPDPGDEARLREDELDALPSDTSQAIRELADYDWRSQAARQTFEQLKDLLRREVLDSQFRGMKEVLQQPDPEAMQRVKDMMADLNEMLEADARGEHTQETSTASWTATATCSRRTRPTWRNWSTRWSAGLSPRSACSARSPTGSGTNWPR